MNLYILRHGIAVELGVDGYTEDSERPLTSEGRQKVKKIAKAMKAMELSFDLVLSSPYARALETAEIVTDVLGCRKQLEVFDALVPDGNAKELIDLLNQLNPLPKNVLLSGHEPYLSELISLLLSGNSHMQVELKKGGFCKLAVDVLKHGRCATLEWLLTPKQMALVK